ncbi:hypothetical protein IID10_18170 [candidate division KSB1 bacterium]|nr:hypothetical protein [candidate division KSB1 bacterium]
MKKKLFALAVITSLYVFFILAFAAIDNQGKVSKFFSDVGLSNETAMASTGSKSNSNSTPSIKRPGPKPKPLKPKPTDGQV